MYRATRRIVCGVADGRSVVLSDGVAPAAHGFAAMPGHGADILWATASVPSDQTTFESAPAGTRAIPAAGETRLLIVTFPPASVMFGEGFDPHAADAEQRQYLPGLAERFETKNPGMHRTDSVDYDIVLKGSIWLELDEGAEVQLQAGDVVIQQATRHAWRNKSDVDAKLAFVLIGTSAA